MLDRRIIILGLILAASSSAAATGSGLFLVDDAGDPLAGVHVSVVGRAGSIRTAPDGHFRLEPEPAPPFELVVFDDAGRLLGTVSVAALDDPADRRLRLVALRAENVQVVSGVAPSILAPPAGAATVLSREEAARRMPDRLIDSLEEVPGTGRSGSGQTAVPTVRGLAGGRTLVMLDDARVTTERRAGASATYLDPFQLESVQVVRGPGSVAYGSDAIGGTIHARTPLPSSGGLTSRFEVSAGAGYPRASGAAEVNVPVGTSAVLFQGYARAFDDYRSPEGVEPNSGARNAGFLARGMVPAGNTRLDFGLQVDRGRDIERPRDDTDVQVTRYPREDSTRLTFGADLPPAGGHEGIEVRAFVGNYRLETERDIFATATDPALRETAGVDADDASARVVVHWPMSGLRVRFGGEAVSRFGLQARDRAVVDPEGASPTVVRDEVTIESADRLDLGAFGEVEAGLAGDRVTLSAGLRGDWVRTRNRGGSFGDLSTSEVAPSGFFAAGMRFGRDWDGTLQVARGFRDPNLSDRYFRGTTGRGVIIGNPDLQPETTRQLDLAVRGAAGPFRLATYGYLYDIHDLVERYEVAPDVFGFRNRAQQRVVGVEAEADLLLGSRWSARGTLTWVRGEIVDDDTPAADIPAPTVTLSVHNRPSPRWWWRAALRFEARDDRPGEGEIVTPSFAVVDASAGWRFREALELRMVLGNVMNTSYPWSPDRRAPLAPGRTVHVLLGGSFGGR